VVASGPLNWRVLFEPHYQLFLIFQEQCRHAEIAPTDLAKTFHHVIAKQKSFRSHVVCKWRGFLCIASKQQKKNGSDRLAHV
jgi:hypothetical protein